MFKHLELKIKYLNNIYTNNSLKIIEKENINSSILFRSSRVGLVKSDEYSPCPYRYIKNNSEYRKHSNFKEKTLVFYYSLVLGIDSNEIKNFTDLKNLDFDKFLKNLNKGPFRILCQLGKIKNTKGHKYENRNRCRAIC